MKSIKILLVLCFLVLLTSSALAAPPEKATPVDMKNLLSQSELPIKEMLSNFFIETDTHFYTPSTIIDMNIAK